MGLRSLLGATKRNRPRDILDSLLSKPLRAPPSIRGPVWVVGSGPGAAIPADLDANWSVASVNASEVVADRLGASPNLTLFGTVLKNTPANRDAKKVLAGGGTGILILPKSNGLVNLAPFRLARLGYTYSRRYYYTRSENLAIVRDFIGEEIPDRARPSNGIILPFLCLKFGAQKVVMSGFSFSNAGHAYNDKGLTRRHIDEDRHILSRAIDRGLPIFTNDPAFAAESGLPLYSGTPSWRDLIGVPSRWSLRH
ncbi:hypothetical protein IZ6_11050 [Terrihabitans soli]|uniref:Uncharacterized protein n=1 Tax=Terrihabitans soli TaxID=708113 RepID=A0A6S6QTU7_9HYPH|nr:hypothetical protein [Terrihabitans soli]BCJ90370.1 hypothetical protein IZ6_11050 [Terrihabitans soli]